MEGYVGGFLCGVSQAIVGHPLDTLKTWRQNQHKYKQPTINCRNLWRGVSYPLIQLPIICSVSFGLYENIYSHTKQQQVAGAASGFLRCFVVTPLEYYKIRRQQQLPVFYNQCFRNFHVVCMKEVPSSTIFFTSYSYVKEKTNSTFLAGGSAGVLSWFSIYPIDTIKTRIQAGGVNTIGEALRQGNLYNGLSMCIIRAFLTSSIGFCIYNKTKNLILNNNKQHY